MSTVKEYLNKEYMSRLYALTMDVRIKSAAGYDGIRKAKGKGQSLEFSDFKDYAAGDDIRKIDWNSYSRFGKLYVKQFSDERQATVNLFIDRSRSMNYGGFNKLYYAKLLAASLSYITLNNSDCVNIFFCDSAVSAKKINIRGKNLFPQIVSFLDENNVSSEKHIPSESKLTGSITGLSVNLGYGASYIISDFFTDDGYEEAVKYLQGKKQSVTLVHLLSQEESKPGYTDGVRLIDSETLSQKDIYISADIINKYEEALNKFIKCIESFCKKMGVRYVYTETSEHPLIPLSKLL